MMEEKYEKFNKKKFFFIIFLFRFDEAITYFCVACEYNLRLSKQSALPMKAMDSYLLFKIRRLCFQVIIFYLIDFFLNFYL
jgi:hypothetical protein